MLEHLYHAMKTRGIEFRLAEAHGAVRDALRRAGFEDHYGRIIANQTVSEVIAAPRAGDENPNSGPAGNFLGSTS